MGNVIKKPPVSSEILWENRWAEQSSQIACNPIYSLVDIYGGGRLIDCFEQQGVPAVRRIIKEEVAQFLYKGGDGIEVSGSDLIRKPVTKYEVPDEDPLKTRSAMVSTLAVQDLEKSTAAQLMREQPRKNVPMRLFNSAAGVYDNSAKHLVCWDITKRGIYGETLLHLCLLHKTPAHRHIAMLLVAIFPNLVKDIFIGWEYFGQSALHMAILNNDFELVKVLVQSGADITQRAVGDFFQPDDQRSVRKARHTNYRGHTYYGEYPLSFACCIGSPEIYDYLICSGADPSCRDQLGNSVLHMLVIHNQTEVYRLALRHYKRPADPKAVNAAGLNPISLAAKLGRRDVFNEIVDLSASEMWRFSNIACKVYPLSGMDTIGPNGRTDWDSAFMYIINGKTNEHLDMLDEGVIRQLLYEKWHKYVRNRFLQRLALIIVYLTIMTIAVYLRPQENWNPINNSTGIVRVSIQVNPENVVRYVCEIITVVNSVITLYFNFDEMREQGFRAFMRTLSHAPPRAVFMIACLLITLAAPARIGNLLWTAYWQEMTLLEESLLILAIPCVWTYLLFFAGWEIGYLLFAVYLCNYWTWHQCV